MGSFASACRSAVVEATALSPLLLALLAFGPARAGDYELQRGTTNLLVAVEGTPEALDAAVLERAAPPQALVAAPQVVSLFDADVPAQGGARAAAAPRTQRRWLLVSPPKAMSVAELSAEPDVNPWDTAHDVADGLRSVAYQNLLSSLPIAAGVRVVTVEPDVQYIDRKMLELLNRQFEDLEAAKCKGPTTPGTLIVCDGWKPHWPHPENFAWHLDDDYSQLAQARDSVPEASPAERVTVAHLDTGYDPNANGTNPPHFDPAHSHDFTRPPVGNNQPAPGGEATCDNGFPFHNRSHGTGTLGILATGQVEVPAVPHVVPAFKGRLGGVPQARVVEYRVSGTVANWRTYPMAWAIATAPIEGVDVISMSMGALPSQPLVDAVNEAYMNGTAVVTAAGNFALVPILRIHTPTLTVPPAYFNRVLSVTGVTSKERTYSKAPCFPSFLCEPFWKLAMRGSFGPSFAMKEAIASYTPNIPWIEFSGDGIPPGLVRLNGEGTSAATPQVAAAVALWLQKHRNDFSAADWRSWRKVQAAFEAVWTKAKPSSHTEKYRGEYFGAGILQAAKALGYEIPPDLAPRDPATIGFFWVDALLTLGGPAIAGPARLVASERELLRVHQEMFKSELAQLVFASRGLQEILGGLESDELDKHPAQRTALLAAVREDPACSQRLRAAIDRALASGS